MLSTSLIPFKNDGGDARHSLTEGREPGRHVVHAGTHKRIIAERRKAVRGDDNRPVDGCDWCWPHKQTSSTQNNDNNDCNAGLCEICNHLHRSLGWAKGQTKSGLIRFDKLKKEGEGAGGVLHFYSVKTFLQETTEDANKFAAAKGLMQVSSSSANSSSANSTASSQDVSEDSLFAISNRDGGSSNNGGKRDGDDEGLESSSPAKKQKAAAETGGESGQNNNIEGQQGGGCDEEDDAKDRVLRCLFGNNSLDRETEEYYRESIAPAIAPAMAAARGFKQSKIKAAEEKAREEMMSPIRKKLYALQNDKAAIEGKVEEFDALRRTVAQRGYGASMPDEAVEAMRASFKKEMESIDEKLSAERASLTRMEALLADGIKQMQTKIDRDLGLDVHDAAAKALEQRRERRKRTQVPPRKKKGGTRRKRKQGGSLENESASRSDSPSF